MRPLALLLPVVLAFPLCMQVVDAGENKPKQDAQHFCGDFRINDDAHTIVIAVEKSEAALFSCSSVQRHCFDDEIEWLRMIGEAAYALPHRLGLTDVMYLASVLLDEQPYLKDSISEALFGRVAFYEITLWDVPRGTTLKNLQLLSRLPKYDNFGVRILTDHPDKQLFEATKALHVHCDMEDYDLSGLATTGGRVAGTVLDSQGKPVAGATIAVCARDGKPISHIKTTDKLGQFVVSDMPRVPYQIRAYHPSPWVTPVGASIAYSDSINAESGDSNVRIVLDAHR